MLKWVSDKNLYLAGFMASGKTTVARLLSRRLNIPWRDTDSRLVEIAGMSIPDIFAQHGELYFRSLESRTLREVAAERPKIVALGGGVILSEENLRLAKSTGALVCLLPSVDVLWGRLRKEKDRPLLFASSESEKRAKLEQLYRAREAVYRQAADLLIEQQEEREPSVALEEIVFWLERIGWIASSR